VRADAIGAFGTRRHALAAGIDGARVVSRRSAAVADGSLVGGKYSSQRGSTAKRLITPSAARAFSSRMVAVSAGAFAWRTG